MIGGGFFYLLIAIKNGVKNVPLWGGTIRWLDICWVKLFTRGKDGNNNNHGKNSYRDQAGLYIHIAEQCVEFFHNLKFKFSKMVYKSGFQRVEQDEHPTGAIQREYGD